MLQEQPQEFSPELRTFIEQSIARDDEAQFRLKARRQRVIAGLASLTAIAMLAAGVAVWQLQQARRAQTQYFRSAAAGLLDKEPLNAAINALAGMEGMNVNQPVMEHRDHRLLGVLGLGLANNAAVSRA